MSHETIYQYIWRDKAEGGFLWKYLRQSSKQRRKRYKAYDSRGRLTNKRQSLSAQQALKHVNTKGIGKSILFMVGVIAIV